MKKIYFVFLSLVAVLVSGQEFITSTNSVGEVILTSYQGFPTNHVVVIPSQVNVIGNFCFQNRLEIESIYVPDSVKSIGFASFYGLSELRHIRMSTNLVSVGDAAFWFCSKLESIKLPPEVKIQGENAFTYCYSLDSWKPWIVVTPSKEGFVLIYEGRLEASKNFSKWLRVTNAISGKEVLKPIGDQYFRTTE